MITNPKSWLTDRAKKFPDYFKRDQNLLHLLTSEFDLKLWENVEARLAELQAQYMPMLELRDEE